MINNDALCVRCGHRADLHSGPCSARSPWLRRHCKCSSYLKSELTGHPDTRPRVPGWMGWLAGR